jgi:hypothetical protein
MGVATIDRATIDSPRSAWAVLALAEHADPALEGPGRPYRARRARRGAILAGLAKPESCLAGKPEQTIYFVLLWQVLV